MSGFLSEIGDAGTYRLRLGRRMQDANARRRASTEVRAFATGLRWGGGESQHVPAADRPMLLRFLTDLTLRRAIGAIIIVAFVFTLLAALLMLVVERKTYGNYGNACWWSVQTVTTVGYGDNPPVTPAGRVIGAIVMLFGIALIPAITSLVTAVFINQQIRGGSDHRRP